MKDAANHPHPKRVAVLKKSRMAFFRCDESEYSRLAAIARGEDRPVSHVVRRAVREYLERRAS